MTVVDQADVKLRRLFAWSVTERGLVSLAIIFGLLLRVLAQPLHPFLGDDSDDYGAFARGLMLLVAGDEWRDTPAAIGGYGYSPGYPLVTAILSFVTGNIWVAGRVISLIAGLAVIYFTHMLGRDLFGARTGLLAGWVVALSSVMVGQSARVATEMMFALLILITLILVFRAMRKTEANTLRSRLLWGAGVSIGFAAMTRPEGFVIGAAILVLVAWNAKQIKLVVPLAIPVGALMIIWSWSGFLGYFVDHYRGVNSAVDAGLSLSKFGTQIASQSFHLATGALNALGLVVLLLAVIGAWLAMNNRLTNHFSMLLLFIVAFDAVFLVVTPGLGDMNRYVAVMVPILAVFAAYGVAGSADMLRVGVPDRTMVQRVLTIAMVLVVVSVFNARAIGDRVLTWSHIAASQTTALGWIDDYSDHGRTRIFDLAGIAQVRFAKDPDAYEFIGGSTADLEALSAGYDFVVLQQPDGERHVISDRYVAAVDVLTDNFPGETLVFTIYTPTGDNRGGEVIRLRAERIETIWDRFWSVQ